MRGGHVDGAPSRAPRRSISHQGPDRRSRHEGQPIASIEGDELTAPLAGILRGLTRNGVYVARRTEVIEVDPRGPMAEVTGISERPRRIAEAVLAAIRNQPAPH